MKTRSKVVRAALGLMCVALLSAGARTADPSKPASTLKRRVAIAPFGVTAPGLAGGQSEAVGRISTGLLAGRLKTAGGFLLVDKSNNHALADACDSVACHLSLLKTGAEYMIAGTVVKLYCKDSLSRAHHGLPPMAEAVVSLRMVDVPSGTVIYSGQAHGEAAATAAAASPSRRPGADRRIMGLEPSLAEGAIDKALAPLVDAAIAKCIALPWTAYIISSDAGAYILSCGAVQGIRTGDRFAVYQYSQHAHNAPAKGSGHPVGVMEIGMTVGSRGTDRDAVSVGQMINGSLDPAALDQYYLALLR